MRLPSTVRKIAPWRLRLLHHLDSTTRVAPFEHVPRAPLSLSLACRVPQTRRSSCMSAARRSYSR
jgi:hypothetical protein